MATRDAKQPITMLSDRLLVQIPQAEGERRSRSGILIPATAEVGKRLAWAEVVGEEYLILRERDIHAVASDRNDDGTGLYL